MVATAHGIAGSWLSKTRSRCGASWRAISPAAGLQVREVGTAHEAVQAVSSDPPDLLLPDINLPDQTGWDVLRELKRHGSPVPTIIISAVRVNQNRLDEFHPLAYLPKPFPLDALLRLVLGRE